jgi:uncharacterized protein (UPF0371 family)
MATSQLNGINLMSDDDKQPDGSAEELIAWQQAGEAQAQQRYRQVREQLERLTRHLGLINDEKQIEQLLAERKEMNEAHAIVREAPRPRWLPGPLHRLLTRLAGAVVIPHLRETEQQQTRYNIHATKTINELSTKLLRSEKIILEHQEQLAKLLAALLTALEMKIDALAPGDEGPPPELRQLESEIARMNALLEQFQQGAIEDHPAEDAPPQPGAPS